MSSSTSIKLNKHSVLDACYHVQQEIFLERRAKLDKLVSMFEGEIRFFFGLLQRKPATDRVATETWLAEHEPFFHSGAAYHRSKELALVQSIGHLIQASGKSQQLVRVSASDFVCIQTAWGRGAEIRASLTAERLLGKIARGHVPPPRTPDGEVK